MKQNALFIVATMGILALCATSCEKGGTNYSPKTLFNPSEEFSIILSKALHDNEDLREFIKNEALAQFDKDFDVFYPFAKDKLVDGKQSFESILKSYDERNTLESIERQMPLLNIFVPDWSWAEGFSVISWDTSDSDISVAYKDEFNAGLQLYNNGEKEFFIEYGQLTNFPVLIVRQNERMKRGFDTKSSCPTYDFIDPEFDGTKTKGDEYWDRMIDDELIQDYSNYMSEDELSGCSAALEAYSLFKNHPCAVHRDYIYYGMTNEITAGKLNVHVTEKIAKYRFETLNTEFFFDSDDFVRTGAYTRYVKVPDQTLINKFIYEGNLELYFHISIGNSNGTPSIYSKFSTVSFRDAFQLKKVHVRYRNKTALRDPKWVFTVDEDECFVPKWINANMNLPKWDISSQSSVINISVSEYDNEQEEVESFSVVSSFSQDFKFEGEVDSIKIGNKGASGKVKVTYGITDKEETTQSISIKTKKGSDDLGRALMYYTDPVVISEETRDNKKGYRIKDVNTGFVHMLIIPVYE